MPAWISRKITNAPYLRRFARLERKTITRIKAALFVLALLPFARLFIGAFTGQLGTNPVELITRSTGTWTLVMLCLTLCISPLRVVTGWGWVMNLRRMLGLFAFFYVFLHFFAYVWFDFGFDVAEILKDVWKRPFVTVGFAGFLLMLPLALTSFDAAVKRLGFALWQRVHWAIYAIAPLGVIHYWWLVKRDLTEPIIYALIVALLLGVRVWFARR
jgi:methionine sulfoxide reductase heme-binding subunit